MRRLVLSTFAAASLFLPAGDALGAADKPGLSVLGDEPLAVGAQSGRDHASAYLTVFNPAVTSPKIRVSFDPATPAAVRVESFTPSRVAGQGRTRVRVVFGGLKALRRKPLQGQVVVDGGKVPITRAVAITPSPQPTHRWPLLFVVGALAMVPVFFLSVALCVLLRGKGDLLGEQAPGPKWSYDSWATTLTAIGAILGTVLGGAVLPAVPREAGKDTFVALNLLFGAMVVSAPFFFQAMRRPGASPADQEAGLWGYNWTLLFACSITCAAVLGELATLALVAWELIGGGAWSVFALVALSAVGLLALWYFLVTAWWLATTKWKEEAAKATAEVGGSGAVIGTASGGQRPIRVVSRQTWSLP